MWDYVKMWSRLNHVHSDTQSSTEYCFASPPNACLSKREINSLNLTHICLPIGVATEIGLD